MPSVQSKLFFSFLKIVNAKNYLKKVVETDSRNTQPFFSPIERKKYNVVSLQIDQHEVSIMGADRETNRHIIYFHGGMYRVKAINSHKKWMVKLLKNTDCRVSYVDYPLAPEHTYPDTLKMVVKTYQFLSDKYPRDEFILMGDSAGGGLALVLAQYLRDHQIYPHPIQLILYSPWVRLDMQNPDLQDIAQKDVLLDLDTLNAAAEAYAGNTSLTNKHLSPYFGGCEGLGNIHIFYGSNELLAPDISLFRKSCEAHKSDACFHCYEGMQHVFQLFTFLPESKQVFKQTTGIINHS